MRDDRSSYVDAAAWAVLVAGAVPWCRRCRVACPGHPVTADAVEQLPIGPPAGLVDEPADVLVSS